ncbi:MAG: acyl-CoA dehydrogenase family protein [Pseudomonadota bacterium]|nr:acyl-CoA dehydrogenase family protein [Pseudomonadota bacterium]
MNFSLSDEQQMLLETTRRLLGKEYDFATRQRLHRDDVKGIRSALWQNFAELGLLAINVPESEGGLGAGAIETMLVMSAMGEALVLEPFLASAVMASHLVVQAANATQRAELLPAMISGDLIAVPAHDEASTRFDWTAIETRARPVDGGYLLRGRKSLVPYAATAHLLLVTARMPDQSIALFGVPRNNAGVDLNSYHCVDSSAASEVTLLNVVLPADARFDGAADLGRALAGMQDHAVAAVCAEAVGILDKLLDATVTHTRERRQFGAPIASFQALQHRMADMVLHIEQARSMATLAAVRCKEADDVLRAKTLSAAKVVIGQACRFVGQQAVQLHGGMGVTDELIVSHYFKRLMAIELQFGSTDQHLQAFAAHLAA